MGEIWIQNIDFRTDSLILTNMTQVTMINSLLETKEDIF